jgi:2',3'-cyclic-nucleotide 2'-phosphodiesterase (5'-nucleotidase family)
MKANWLFLVCIILSSCTRVMHVADIQQRNYLITSSLDSLPVEELFISEIAPYKALFEEEMGRVIGEVTEPLYKRQPESNMTHWMADVLSRQAAEVSHQQIDLTILNYGGIRLPNIPEGPITVGKIYELMPFDNHIVIIRLTGALVREVFEHIAAKNGVGRCVRMLK